MHQTEQKCLVLNRITTDRQVKQLGPTALGYTRSA